ncbi:MAG: M23 family metallopeptidase [Oscillospiraceae bacterium]|nr:M23 family metallopeptidase [Oscillospiraceae bacterium]
MSKIKFSKGKVSKFLSSKGFYAAIAICLVGAGAATWLAVDRTITGTLQDRGGVIQHEDMFRDFPQAEEAEKEAEEVVRRDYSIPIDRPSQQQPQPPSRPSLSSSTQPSSPERQSEPEGMPEQSPPSERLPTLAYASPVVGNITNPFSNGELVKNVTLGDWRTHDGIDIASEKGADVYAVANGVVSSVRNDPLWGTVITVDHHDGRQSIYSGLNSVVTVQEGEIVLGRQTLGKVEGVPCEIAEESHIHFAMKENGAWIDPLTVLPR